jgi:hypothetical protein
MRHWQMIRRRLVTHKSAHTIKDFFDGQAFGDNAPQLQARRESDVCETWRVGLGLAEGIAQ